VYPLEASGTSGMKAGMNGVINLSILDGWWDEGYDGENGWPIKPAPPQMDPHRRDQEEARSIYETLLDSVIPMYYKRAENGYSVEWIRMAKRSMASLLPRYDASRMLAEYVSKYYQPASRQSHLFMENGNARAKELAQWKARVRAAWPHVAVRRLDTPKARIQFGDSVRIEVGVRLNGLTPSEVTCELLLSRDVKEPFQIRHMHQLTTCGAPPEAGEYRFHLDLKPGLSGRLDYRIRIYPKHEFLTHPFEMGLMRWV
jgi:starch phosphorylase